MRTNLRTFLTTSRAAAVLRPALAAAAGALASVAYSVSAANWFLLVALAVLFFLTVSAATRKEAFFTGWLWGLLFFSIGLRWCYGSLHYHGGLPAVAAVFAVILLGAVLGLFPAAAAALTRAAPVSRRLKLIVLMPALWSILELLRGVEPFGFGWLSAGYAYASDFFGAWAPVAGVYGVGFAAALTAGFAVELLFPQQEKKAWLKTLDAIALGALIIGTLALGEVSWSSRGKPLEVRLVQPDLPVMMVYDRAAAQQRLERAAAMSVRAAMGSRLDLIVWPESTVAYPLRDGLDPAALLAYDAAQKTGADVLFNAFYREGPGRYYNGLWIARNDNRPAQLVYRKHHLVPFGEYVPWGFRWFVDALGIPMSDQTPGKVGGDPFAVAGVSAAAGICYENMFGEELRHAWDKVNPGFILNTANLGWFGESVLNQFTAMSAMRARETARPLVQAVQNAGSALIGPDGRVERQALSGAQNIDLTLVTAEGGPTPFVRFGHWPLAALLALLLAAVLGHAFLRRPR